MIDPKEDTNNDGVPDVIEKAIQKSGMLSKTFTKRNLYLFIIICVIAAGYGIFGYMYMSIRNENIALQNQFDWQKSENEIEINKARIDERRKTIIELKESIQQKRDALQENQNHVIKILENLDTTNKDFNDEVQSMEVDDIIHAFAELGYSAKQFSCK